MPLLRLLPQLEPQVPPASGQAQKASAVPGLFILGQTGLPNSQKADEEQQGFFRTGQLSVVQKSLPQTIEL